MKRQQREVALELPAADRDKLRSSGSVFRYRDLILRVRADKVRARLAEGGRYNSPPHFRGRASESADGSVVIRGAIRESMGQVVMPRICWFVALWMVVLIVIGIASGLGSGGLPPFLIGAIGLPIFAAISVIARQAAQGQLPVERGQTRVGAAVPPAVDEHALSSLPDTATVSYFSVLQS